MSVALRDVGWQMCSHKLSYMTQLETRTRTASFAVAEPELMEILHLNFCLNVKKKDRQTDRSLI